jgi:hypothetical protein
VINYIDELKEALSERKAKCRDFEAYRWLDLHALITVLAKLLQMLENFAFCMVGTG